MFDYDNFLLILLCLLHLGLIYQGEFAHFMHKKWITKVRHLAKDESACEDIRGIPVWMPKCTAEIACNDTCMYIYIYIERERDRREREREQSKPREVWYLRNMKDEIIVWAARRLAMAVYAPGDRSQLGTFLLLNRYVDCNSPDPPPVVDGCPPHPNCYRMPSLSSGGFKMHDVCICIHLWRLKWVVSRI